MAQGIDTSRGIEGPPTPPDTGVGDKDIEASSVELQIERLQEEIGAVNSATNDLREQLTHLEEEIAPILAGETEHREASIEEPTPKARCTVGEEVYSARKQLLGHREDLQSLSNAIQELKDRVTL